MSSFNDGETGCLKVYASNVISTISILTHRLGVLDKDHVTVWFYCLGLIINSASVPKSQQYIFLTTKIGSPGTTLRTRHAKKIN